MTPAEEAERLALKAILHSYNGNTISDDEAADKILALGHPAAPGGEPVGWQKRNAGNNDWTTINDCSDENLRGLSRAGWKIRPVYAALAPSNPPGDVRDKVIEDQVCAGGIDPGFDECPKCGATMDESCAFQRALAPPTDSAAAEKGR